MQRKYKILKMNEPLPRGHRQCFICNKIHVRECIFCLQCYNSHEDQYVNLRWKIYLEIYNQKG